MDGLRSVMDHEARGLRSLVITVGFATFAFAGFGTATAGSLVGAAAHHGELSAGSTGILQAGWAPAGRPAVTRLPLTRVQEMYDTSFPEPGSVLKQSPEVITIKFTQGIYFKDVHLFSADHVEYPLEWTLNEEDVFQVELRVPQTLPPGAYEIQWWADVRQHYHPDGGVITFTIAPGDGAARSEAVIRDLRG